MAKKSVVDYVKSMLQGGYQISSIRAAMLKSSYTNEDIDDAVKEAYHPTIRHEIHLGPTVLFVAILVILVGGGVAYFTLNPSKAPDKLLDVNLEPVQTTVKPGESIIFLKELSNLGTEARYDVIIKQEILDPITFKPIAEKTETRAIETFGSTKTQILIPQDSRPGDYILRAIVEYDAKKAVATIPIKIVPAGKETLQDFCNDGIQNQDETGVDCGGMCKPCEVKGLCNDNDPCTKDEHADGKCSYSKIAPCCGNGICETGEANICDDCKPNGQLQNLPTFSDISKIRETAKTDPDKAVEQCNSLEVQDLRDSCISNVGEVQLNRNYCVQIVNSKYKDVCYSNIAKSSNDNSICGEIVADGIRDSCYMTFVLDNKDYSVCGKLTNKQLRQSCEYLNQLHEL